MNAYKVGLDIGSTTAKMVVLDKNETMVLFSGYKRHQAKIQECLLAFLHQIKKQLGDIPLSFISQGLSVWESPKNALYLLCKRL